MAQRIQRILMKLFWKEIPIPCHTDYQVTTLFCIVVFWNDLVVVTKKGQLLWQGRVPVHLLLCGLGCCRGWAWDGCNLVLHWASLNAGLTAWQEETWAMMSLAPVSPFCVVFVLGSQSCSLESLGSSRASAEQCAFPLSCLPQAGHILILWMEVGEWKLVNIDIFLDKVTMS